jgi:DNA modification methylase
MTRPAIGQAHLFTPPPPTTLTLEDRFLVPPFSVLDTRAGYWQTRKRAWLALGIQGELGRSEELEDNAIYGSDADRRQRWEGSAYPRGAKARELALMDSAEGRERGLLGGLPHVEGTGGLAGALVHESHADYKARMAAEAKGLDSSAGRGDRLLSGATPREGYGGDWDLGKGENAWGGKGTSVFDPVLCELAYRWFSPEGGLVVDPFAGGSVRGIVAAALSRRYFGTDLSVPQLEANARQVPAIRTELQKVPGQWKAGDPQWQHADARDLLQYVDEGTADLIFTCPPYYDLEVYSEDPADLSRAATYQEFVLGYRQCIAAAATALRDDRFAILVVGEVRDKKGGYHGLVPDTIRACEDAGLRFYNEGILVTSVGSLPIRTSRLFAPGRKLGKSHQNVLVFVKGSWKAACEACADVQDEYGEVVTSELVELDLEDTSTPAF